MSTSAEATTMLAEQNDIGAKIDRALENIGKLETSKRTIAVYEAKQEELQKWWETFCQNHDKLEISSHVEPSNKYFIGAFWNSVQNCKNKYELLLNNAISDLHNPNGNGNNGGGSSSTPSAQLVSFGNLLKAMERMIKDFEKYSDRDKPNTVIIGLLEQFKSEWNILQKLHAQLVLADTNYQSGDYIRVQEKYKNTMVILNTEAARTNVPVIRSSTRQPGTTSDNMKLPKISLPNFDGDYLKWMNFRELFQQMIGSTQISGTQKLMYLKQNIVGEAANLLQHLQISEANYVVAWQALENRYNNPRLITSALLGKVFKMDGLKTESAGGLRKMHDTLRECSNALDAITTNIPGGSTYWREIIFHHIALEKLDPNTHALYEQTVTDPHANQDLNRLLEFMEKRFQALESINGKGTKSNFNQPTHQKDQRGRATALISTNRQQPSSANTCDCKEKHLLYKCPKFLALSPNERFSRVKKSARCINCFKDGHSAKECNSRSCSTCNKKHNTLLHFDAKTTLFGSAPIGVSHVFLATAIIHVVDKHGVPIKVRALLDSGSQLNVMTEKTQNKIGLKVSSTSMQINGLGGAGATSSKRATVQLKSMNSAFTTMLEFYIVKKMTTCQPAKSIDISTWKLPSNITLADPKFNVPAGVDIIIGGELFFKLLSNGYRAIGENLPDLQNTVFGWVVTGKLLGLENKQAFSGMITNQDLSNDLNKFWAIEERYLPAKQLTNDEEDCEQYFENTTIREAATGKFIVNLQFTKEPSVLGKSEDMAVRRFMYLEKRFKREPDTQSEYIKFMDEYERLGHMEEVPRNHLPENMYVIPHHFVLNPGSSTTKFRVVFDASAKTTSNISLNEILATGPMLQDDLFSIMVRFRKHRYVFSADIGKMYRQVLVNPKDQKYQMIVWRKNPRDELKYYKLKTLTYGTTCAAYLAIKTLQHLADEHQETYPLAAMVAKRDFNVDDVMTGSNDLNEAIELQQQLIEMLKLAGMDLHKWCANHKTLLEAIPQAKHDVSLDINGEKTETKALGMKWIPRTDKFMLRYTPKEHDKTTKRTVLSETAQLFDPLGLVNPVIIMAKVFLQELWAMKLDWDDALPAELATKWSKFRSELIRLNEVEVSRPIIISDPVNIQLHAFSDASSRAYGAVFYIRSENQHGEVNISLICSKSRVAPISATTLPRLELCGAVIMSEMAEKLQKILDLTFDKIVYWTDSEVVLSWILTNGCYKTFVANRVASIIRKTNLSDWRYVNTKVNPADLLSRGVSPEKLLQSELWWNGPEFLKLAESEWPIIKPAFVREEAEERAVKTILLASEDNHFIGKINHHNSIATLKRVVAYCHRVAKPKDLEGTDYSTTSLSVNELQRATDSIIQHCQQASFPEDIKFVKNGQPEKSQFLSLSPIYDEHSGILRVGGRLQASNITFEQKHPALLPKDHEVTRLIMEEIHRENHHAGAQALLAITRQRYWPINGKRVAQSIIGSCILCTRSKPHLMGQIMGNLPAERVTADRPYVTVGLDFAGPITIHYKLRGKRVTKAYICVFVCFVTKAVHLEAATDLTTAAFLNCLKRFIARRGNPKKIFSDNGTNFVGANNQLTELAALIGTTDHKQQVERYCQDHHIDWKFIPPRSPHFAGLVEAAVKSAKLHLIKILHNMDFTYDELITALAEIEAILNSRPLTPMSNDPNDLQPLTAGHFLIGMPMNGINDSQLPHRSMLSMWQKIKTVRGTFWERWSKEYLAELQYRHKWTKERDNVIIGSLVIMKEENIPPLQWRMARVISTAEDKNGHIRVVELQTKNGILKRSIHQICPLPVATLNSDDEITNMNDKQAIMASSKLHAAAAEFTPRKHGNKPEATNPGIPGRNVRSGVFPKNLGVIPKNNQRNRNGIVKQVNHQTRQNQIEKRLLDRSGDSMENQQNWNSRLRQRDTIKASSRHWDFYKKPNVAILIVAFLGLILGAMAEEPCPVTTFKHNPGLYYEDIGQVSLSKDEWEIKCHLDMETYWREEEGIKKIIDQLKKVCPEAHPAEYCKTTAEQFDQQMATLQMKNELIHGFSSDQLRERRAFKVRRTKRGWFNGFGVAGKEVFGLLNEDDAQKFENEIAELRVNKDHIQELLGNQTSIQEITENIIKRDEVAVQGQFKHILSEIENIKSKDIIGKMSVFTSLSLQAMTLMTGYREVQSAILGILSHLNHGRVPAILITPNQMRRQLMFIMSYIAHDTMVPGDEQSGNLSKLYTMLSAKVRLTRSNLLIVIGLPLVNREYYKLYHILPVPFMYNGKMATINPSVKYIGVNLKQDHYYLLSEAEYGNCQRYNQKQLICRQNHPLYNVQGTNTVCEMAVILHPESIPEKCSVNIIRANQTWSKLVSPNQYLFTMANKTSVTMICGTNILPCTLNGTGIITIGQQCVLKGGIMEISAINTYSSDMNPMLIPSSNITEAMADRIMAEESSMKHNDSVWAEFEFKPDKDPQLRALEQAIQTQKNNNVSLRTMDWHDVHHYSIIYFVVIIVMVILIFKYGNSVIRAKLCPKGQNSIRRQQSTDATLSSVENMGLDNIHSRSESMFNRPATVFNQA